MHKIITGVSFGKYPSCLHIIAERNLCGREEPLVAELTSVEPDLCGREVPLVVESASVDRNPCGREVSLTAESASL